MHCWCKCAAVSWEDAGGLAAADGAGAGAEAAAPLFLASQVGFGARTEWLPSHGQSGEFVLAPEWPRVLSFPPCTSV